MKKILSILTAMAMLICFFPFVDISAAEAVSYVYYTVNSDNSLTKKTGSQNAEVIDGNITSLKSGWYAVTGDVTTDFRIEISGTANLILTDGCTLELSQGMHLLSGNTLNIYAQSEGADMGKLKIYNDSENAAIGGDSSATDGENCGSLTIYGGDLDITSDISAAIGGGNGSRGNGGNGGNVTVYGGDLNFWSKMDSATLGGGFGDNKGGSGGTLTVYGGKMYARADSCVAIGGGNSNTEFGAAGRTRIFGGAVKAQGAVAFDHVPTYGSGYIPLVEIMPARGQVPTTEIEPDSSVYGSYGISITKIDPSDVSREDYIYYELDGTTPVKKTGKATGILIDSSADELTGWYVVKGDVILNERVSVYRTANLILTDGSTLIVPKGIKLSEGNTLNIYGQSAGTGKLYVDDSSENAAIGGDGSDTNGENCGSLTIYGGDIKIITSPQSAAIGGGNGSGGNGGNGGTVIVYDGNLYAKSGFHVTIGGGYGRTNGGNGSSLSVYGGKVTAASDSFTAIGGGKGVYSDGSAGSTKLYGGTVTATGEKAFDHVPTYGPDYISKVSYGDDMLSATVGIAPDDSVYSSKYVSIENTGIVTDYVYYELNGTTPVEKSGSALCVPIDSSTTSLTSGRYVVNKDVTVSSRIGISGTVDLILTDGSKLTAGNGIYLPKGSTLNIYGQSAGTGKLNASYASNGCDAALGGNMYGSGGSLIIHGGEVSVNAGTAYSTAVGGGSAVSPGMADPSISRTGGDGCTVTVYSGKLSAVSSGYNTAIGGGYGEENGGEGGSLTVYGGEIYARSGSWIAIGGGHGDGALFSQAGTTAIYGGTVTADGGFDHVPTYGGSYTPNVSYGIDSSSVTTEISPDSSVYTSNMYVSISHGFPEFEYIDHVLNGTKPVEKTGTAECTMIKASTTSLTSGWYAVKGDVTIADRISISGTVDLILTDGSKLTAGNGIYLPEGSTLNIYGQSAGTGKLNAYNEPRSGAAAIGGVHDADGENNGGSLNVHGGEVTAESSAAAIGGGRGTNRGGNGCRLTVYGGKVTANANDTAIGGGGSSRQPGDGGSVTVYGGEIAAHSNVSAAIGGGYGYDGGGNGGSLTVYGGKVTASSDKGAAISRGYQYHDIVAPITVKLGKGMTAYTSTDVSGSSKTHVTNSSNPGTLFADKNIKFVEISVSPCDHSKNTNPACEGAYCSVCGEYIAPAGHKNADPVIENETEALCENGGTYDEVVYCSVCGREMSRETKTSDAVGHIPAAPVIENETEALCESGGTYDEVVYCSVCGREISRETKTSDALGHIEGAWEVIVMPTPSASGTRAIKCTRCGKILRSEAIPLTAADIPTYTPTESSISQIVFREFPEIKYSVEIRDGKAFITWNSIDGVEKYVVYAVRNGKTTELKRTKETEFEIKHKNGTDYIVRYMRNGVLSPKSKSVNDNVTADKPMVTVTAGKDFARLSWQDMSADKYNIYKYADGKAVKIGSVSGTSVKIKNLKPDTEYKFIVTAVIDGKETTMLRLDIVTVRTKKI